MGYQIEGSGLRKTFVNRRSVRELLRKPFAAPGTTEALRGVDIGIEEGEIFGLLGPNGAGKTTLIKIFCCLVLPDEGRATIDGVDTSGDEKEVKRRIGLVHSDERSFYWRLSARQNLRFFARLYDVPTATREGRIQQLLDKVDMGAAADRPFSGYSSGMKQKIAIARALLHDPPILFMDEPTRSLDPASALDLRQFILEELKQRDGKTIVLATHNLREAEVLSDRMAILAGGRVQQIGTAGEIRRYGFERPSYVLETDAGADPRGPFERISEETIDDLQRITLSLEDGVSFADLMRALLAAGVPVHACDRIEPDLEQAFSRVLGDVEQDG